MKPRTPAPTQPYTPGEQMDRPVDPEARESMDQQAARLALRSDHHALAGSSQGVGSVGFDEPGAYDVSRPAVRPDHHINPDPAALPHADPDPSAEVSRVRAGGLAPGEHAPGDENPGGRMAETDSFERPGHPRDLMGQPSQGPGQTKQP
ncbi:MAG: hypothetical protein V7678_14025 [Brevundimonas sp.]